MTEPKTIKKARDITLKKIKKCIERPIKEREEFWDKTRCAFCSLHKRCMRSGKNCPAWATCGYFLSSKNTFLKSYLRKLYRMVKEIEV